LGDYVVVGGQAGIGGHITIAAKAKIGGQSGVNFDVESGAYLFGTPAMPYMLSQRLEVLHRKLPELFKRVDELEKLLRKS
jgi:UDP-3-O-[3-hydroxymyristoyl] glucosamine N-acyltransferase